MAQDKEPRAQDFETEKRAQEISKEHEAAPPDAAGHAGSFTKPTDVMSRTTSGNGHHPPPQTDRDVVGVKRTSPAWNVVAILILVLALLGLVYVFVAM